MAEPTPQQLAKALTLDERMAELARDFGTTGLLTAPAPDEIENEKYYQGMPNAIGYLSDMVKNAIYGAAKAAVLPGHAAQGGQWTDKDVRDAALNIAGMGGFGSMGLGKAAVGGAGGKVLGAHVYQGGPNLYGPEGAAESLKHIGKGEGAQAYGWGRYDAGNPAVAEQYQRDLAPKVNKTITDIRGPAEQHVVDELEKYIADAGWDDIPNLRTVIRDTMEPGGPNHLAAFDDMASRGAIPEIVSGESYLYTHDLPDDAIARYMDWDKPLSEQSKEVQDFVRTMDPRLSYGTGPTKVKLQRFREGTEQPNTLATGQDLYRDLSNYGDHGQAASEALGKAGIPGLRYLDGGSRRAGEGSHNYVTWDPEVLNRMKLLERDGETFAMTGNPAMLVAGQNQDAGPSKMALELAKRLSDQEFYAKGGI